MMFLMEMYQIELKTDCTLQNRRQKLEDIVIEITQHERKKILKKDEKTISVLL